MRSLSKRVPKSLVDIIEGALAVEQDQRSTLLELIRALETFQQHHGFVELPALHARL